MQEEIQKDKNISRIIKKKFTLRELAGSLGDWGTLIPFIIGYISIVGLNPAGIFFCLGVTNILLGLKHDLPLPVQPQKTIGTVAISKLWSPNLVISTGFGTGIIWALLGISRKMNSIVKKVPNIVVKGIQLGLALILGWAAILLIIDDVLLGVISISIILIMIKSKKFPSAIILVILGFLFMIITNSINLGDIIFNIPYFEFQLPMWENILIGMVIAGFAQIFLTLTNVMIATIALLKELFPEKDDILDANTLAYNMGVINLLSPFLGGMPLCHGSGGLAAQYAFGARTGGSMIMEGMIELFLGLFFSQTLFAIFINFPDAILGAMLLYTAFLLARISFKDFQLKKFPIIVIPALFCYFLNIILGFIVGLALYLIFKKNLQE